MSKLENEEMKATTSEKLAVQKIAMLRRTALSVLFFLVALPSKGLAQEEIYTEAMLSEVRIVGFTYPPRDWAFCDGQILSIAQYSALYSLLGTTYGGDGRSTFALPDLRGRSPVHVGTGTDNQGVELAEVSQGQRINAEKVKYAEDGAETIPGLGMRYIISLRGAYPHRAYEEETTVLADRFTGEICMFAGSFAPLGWANCDGQQLDENEHPALYKALTKTYGGTKTTFSLPDLRGRVPIHSSSGPGLNPVALGQKSDGVQLAIAGENDFSYVMTPSHLGIRFIIAKNGVDPSSRTLLCDKTGEVRMLAGKAIPEGWNRCDEKLLSVSENERLFTLLGNLYGGDGRTTFAVPDLRGRAVLHAGKVPGLEDFNQGDRTSTYNKAVTADSGEVIQTQPTLGISYIFDRQNGSYPQRD